MWGDKQGIKTNKEIDELEILQSEFSSNTNALECIQLPCQGKEINI
jgi:hypothetical protein